MVLRLLVTVGGSYALCAAWVALLALILPRWTGLQQSEAVVLSAMLGIVLYLLVLLWAFSVHSVGRLSRALVIGTAPACSLLFLLR